MTALALSDIHFSYDGKTTILDGVTVAIEKGQVVALTGASGCGKSTLAMIACGVIPKSVNGQFSGHVYVLGEDIGGKAIHETAQNISMVFQDPESQLFAPAVVDEVAFAPENLCYEQKKIISAVENALGGLSMQKYVNDPPHMLSGGQQQLVALASVLSLDPEIIILDEVASQIDEAGVEMIRQVAAALKKRGKTILVIEHGNTLKELCDTVYRLDNGRIIVI